MWATAGRPTAGAVLGAAALLAVYIGVLSLISGWSFAVSQWQEFWPYILALAAGFGAQIGLYLHLKQLSVEHQHGRGVVAATGATSGAAMLACCTHYLANLLPILGTVGLVSVVAQYQTELFWIGLAFNAAGLAYIGRQLLLGRRHFIGSHPC